MPSVKHDSKKVAATEEEILKYLNQIFLLPIKCKNGARFVFSAELMARMNAVLSVLQSDTDLKMSIVDAESKLIEVNFGVLQSYISEINTAAGNRYASASAEMAEFVKRGVTIRDLHKWEKSYEN